MDTERKTALREGLWVWGAAFAVLLLGRYLVGAVFPVVAANLKTLAVLVFLYLPGMIIWRRGQDFRDYGLTFARWRTDLKAFLGVSVVVFPVFLAGFFAFVWLLGQVPESWLWWLGPYHPRFELAWRLPDDFAYLVVTQVLVVALPEEFFYRGFLYDRLAKGLDEENRARRILGVPMGRAFVLTAALFAVGHLTEPYPWRLAVFFPALVFGWMRLKTGTVLGAILFHAAANLAVAVLEASVFG